MKNHDLFHSIHQLSRQLIKHLNEALEPFGLYNSQWSVLYVLKTKGTLTQTELCQYLAVEAPPMTRTIQRLIKLGLVEQIPGNDRRVKYIHLTDFAMDKYPEWEQAVLQKNQKLINQFPLDSQEELLSLITSWLNSFPDNN
ncbi:MarR family winged helix-turn-helix transcriptional regulator [Bacillus sp. PS06]|uniref:MarR family winged helix-turn-helix transcriptional regulator n=1 Tax=Bacillus sp. PS06 TaxID=2764176 RepID=UPI00177C05F9|nr:MarR family transcriptional regulator [Bacillus sp. PS06]MBD8067673.1 MarR family transcriptional regulator [Bacillus sp. PS06]